MKNEFPIEIAIKLEDKESNSAKNYCERVSFDPLVVIGNFFGLVAGLDKIFVKIFIIVFHSFILAQLGNDFRFVLA